VFSNPNNPHRTHKVRLLLADYWFDARHVFLKEIEAPQDAFAQQGWGVQWGSEVCPQLNLGYNALQDVEIINFFARPHGSRRFALMNVPAGTWEVRLQISTWLSSLFGEDMLKKCGTLKKLSVRAGTTTLGFIDTYCGVLDSAVDYLDAEEGNPLAVSCLLLYVIRICITALQISANLLTSSIDICVKCSSP
jgi:hypothetical protein